MTISRGAYPLHDKSHANQRRIVAYTGPASYATGGDSFPPEAVGLGKIGAIHGLTISDGSSLRIGWYDQTNEKIEWYVPDTGAEVANATDLSTFTGRFEVVGQ